MNPPFTVDASVFVSAFSPAEIAHVKSKSFMREVRESNTPIIVPTIVIPEISAAIGRGQGKPDLAIAFAKEVTQFPNLTLISVDEALAQFAAETAARHRLRGSDAIYAAVSLRFGTNLITLDREQLERLKKVLSVHSP